jgi:hypothetical protein
VVDHTRARLTPRRSAQRERRHEPRALTLEGFCAGRGAIEERVSLAQVAREGRRTLELDFCFGKASELVQEIPTHSWEQVIAPERPPGRDRIRDGEARLGAVRHGDGDGAIDLDHGRPLQTGELAVERCDELPIRLVGVARADVASRDGGLEHVWATNQGEFARAVERCEPATNPALVPSAARLLE